MTWSAPATWASRRASRCGDRRENPSAFRAWPIASRTTHIFEIPSATSAQNSSTRPLSRSSAYVLSSSSSSSSKARMPASPVSARRHRSSEGAAPDAEVMETVMVVDWVDLSSPTTMVPSRGRLTLYARCL